MGCIKQKLERQVFIHRDIVNECASAEIAINSFLANLDIELSELESTITFAGPSFDTSHLEQRARELERISKQETKQLEFITKRKQASNTMIRNLNHRLSKL